MSDNPCLSCGACCAAFRVSFYWAEIDESQVSPALIEKLTPHLSCMAGTHRAAPHCAALEGRVGGATACRIYAHRPSPCREVLPGDDKCQRARAKHALPPL
ncbi:MAG: hypothetical protein RIR70_47 [Pseudomonadota bacterium]|jgi:Fe-S-cluster containining protein